MVSSPPSVLVSRRAALAAASLGGLGVVLHHPVASAAQAATPMASPVALPSLLQQWVAAWNAHDAQAIAALYTPDAVYEDVPSNTASTNGDVAGFLGPFFAVVADVQLTPQHGVATADWAVLEYDFAATNNGFIPGAAAQGKSFSVRIATIFALRGDKIQRSSDYYDAATILAQLGMMPGPAATPTG
jgi:steroid delta-isomerase-like uncharacterized protein